VIVPAIESVAPVRRLPASHGSRRRQPVPNRLVRWCREFEDEVGNQDVAPVSLTAGLLLLVGEYIYRRCFRFVS
jgi:hypothetical protein